MYASTGHGSKSSIRGKLAATFPVQYTHIRSDATTPATMVETDLVWQNSSLLRIGENLPGQSDRKFGERNTIRFNCKRTIVAFGDDVMTQ